jgi:DNA-binding LacI/PurR family transcriptional regulator
MITFAQTIVGGLKGAGEHVPAGCCFRPEGQSSRAETSFLWRLPGTHQIVPGVALDEPNGAQRGYQGAEMASMKEVAERAGVSISTVSRVLSRKVPVDAATEHRVRSAIEELNFRPNLLAAGLRSKSGRSIGLVVPRISDPFFSSLIDHVDRAVIERGYNLLLFNTHSDPDFERQIIDNLISRRVDGIIFAIASDESITIELLAGVDIPIVMLDRIADTDKLLSLRLDNEAAGTLASEHFASLGHRRVACVTGPLKVRLCFDRLNGFRVALNQRGIALETECIFEGDFTYSAGILAAERLAMVQPRITAIWAQNDLMAAGVLKGMISRGRRVPEDLSIMGMDDLLVPPMLQPSLTTIVQPIQPMAEKAVEMIMDGIKKVPLERHVVLQPTLAARESTSMVGDPSR